MLNKQYNALIVSLFVIMLLIIIISMNTGKFSISPERLFDTITKVVHGAPINLQDNDVNVFWEIRLPRILAALFVGAALSLAGIAYQGLFLNPMVSPDILGGSAGAGFGAAIAILLSGNIFVMEISGFILSVIAVSISYLLYVTIDKRKNTVLILVLTGIIVQSIFVALTTIIKYIANPEDKLPAITFWLLGGLNTISWTEVIMMGTVLVICSIPLFLIRYRINTLSFGSEEAQSMGVNIKMLRLIILVCATLLTAASVSVSGMVGWVGLVIPHISRFIAGTDYRKSIPVSFLIGAVFLLLMDDIARSLLTIEIPLGILTAIIGAPFFIFLLLRKV